MRLRFASVERARCGYARGYGSSSSDMRCVSLRRICRQRVRVHASDNARLRLRCLCRFVAQLRGLQLRLHARFVVCCTVRDSVRAVSRLLWIWMSCTRARMRARRRMRRMRYDHGARDARISGSEWTARASTCAESYAQSVSWRCCARICADAHWMRVRLSGGVMRWSCASDDRTALPLRYARRAGALRARMRASQFR